jgi:hypothetical protein
MRSSQPICSIGNVGWAGSPVIRFLRLPPSPSPTPAALSRSARSLLVVVEQRRCGLDGLRDDQTVNTAVHGEPAVVTVEEDARRFPA